MSDWIDRKVPVIDWKCFCGVAKRQVPTVCDGVGEMSDEMGNAVSWARRVARLNVAVREMTQQQEAKALDWARFLGAVYPGDANVARWREAVRLSAGNAVFVADADAPPADAPARDTTPDAVRHRVEETAADIMGRHLTRGQHELLKRSIEHVERVPAEHDRAFGNIVGRRP